MRLENATGRIAQRHQPPKTDNQTKGVKMDAKLTKAVIRQLGGRDSLEDIANHGIDGGYGGFIYHYDTIKFFKANRAQIVALVAEMADEFGQSPIQLVAGFNCLKMDANKPEDEAEIARALYGRLASDDTQVPNALAWFAAEEVARQETGN
jgi:hypothetical protein